jgi:hypothetical protein
MVTPKAGAKHETQDTMTILIMTLLVMTILIILNAINITYS